MAKVLDEQSRKAVAATVRYYRDLGIFDLYQREVPEGMTFGRTLEREALAAISAEAPEATLATAIAPEPMADPAQIAAIQADKPAALRVIREDIGDCHRCRLSEARNKIVFGVGDTNARIMFVGEGPGADEDAQGEPFVGRGGQLLNNMISAMGIRREDVHIANVVKCRPPQNRTPERDECEACGGFLLRQISVVRPEVIVALGATAAKFLLGVTDSMGNLRGHIYDFQPSLHPSLRSLTVAPERDPDFKTKLAVTYHPAYLLRDPRQKKETWADLQMVMKYLGMKPPPRAAERPPEA